MRVWFLYDWHQLRPDIAAFRINGNGHDSGNSYAQQRRGVTRILQLWNGAGDCAG